MSRNINELRQREALLRAEGRETVATLEALEAIETPTEDDTTKITALTEKIEDFKGKVEAVAAEIAAEETRIARRAVFLGADPALGLPAGDPAGGPLITSDEPDPALMNGFGNLGEFALAVRAGSPGGGGFTVDPRLLAAPTGYHEEGGGDGEGYMLPPAFRDQIWDLVFDDEDLMGMVDSEETGSNSVEMVKDETTPWGATGVQAKWRAEASQMTATKLVTEGEQVRLPELYAFVTATEELLEDAPRLNARLTKKAPLAIRWKIDDAIVWGTGAGQPLGWMNAGSLISVAKESGQAAATIVVANVLKMYSRMLSGSIKRAVWFANSDIVPQLMTMVISNQPVWAMPGSGMANAPGGFLLGRPIHWSEHAETLGTKGDLMFVDPKGYYLPFKAGGIKFATSIHLFFDYNIQAFRFIFRAGGQPFLAAVVSPAKGSTTRSHFVSLDTRA